MNSASIMRNSTMLLAGFAAGVRVKLILQILHFNTPPSPKNTSLIEI